MLSIKRTQKIANFYYPDGRGFCQLPVTTIKLLLFKVVTIKILYKYKINYYGEYESEINNN